MKITSLTPLKRHLRKDRLHIFQIDAETCKLVREVNTSLLACTERALNRFYEFIRCTPSLVKFFPDESSVKYAREQQFNHWRNMFDARYDEDYFSTVKIIGTRHYELGVEPHIYFSGYSNMIGSINEFASEIEEIKGVHIAALNKVIMLDCELTISAYIDALQYHRLDSGSDSI